jgi:hypothetical protein
MEQLFDFGPLKYGVFCCPKDVTEDECWRGHFVMATLLKSLSRRSETSEHLAKVLGQAGIDEGLRARAQALQEQLLAS